MSPRSAETRAVIMERLENGRAEDVLALVDSILEDLDAAEHAAFHDTLAVTSDALARVLAMDATQRGVYGTAVRDTLAHLGLIDGAAWHELAGNTGVPEDLRGMSANERGVWLSVERLYNATLRAEGVERNPRTMTPFADLVPEAQGALISALIPVFQMVHGVALNPRARRDYEPEEDDRG